MRNLRSYTMTAEQRLDFDAEAVTEALKAAGFTFDRDTCPIRFKRPMAVSENEKTGEVTWTQWEMDA
jgi:hypothetical protein